MMDFQTAYIALGSGVAGGACVLGYMKWQGTAKLRALESMRAAAKALKGMDEQGDAAETAARVAKEAKLLEMVKDEVATL